MIVNFPIKCKKLINRERRVEILHQIIKFFIQF